MSDRQTGAELHHAVQAWCGLLVTAWCGYLMALMQMKKMKKNIVDIKTG